MSTDNQKNTPETNTGKKSDQIKTGPAPKKRRWPWVILVLFLLLFPALRWFAQSDLAFDWIRKQAETAVSELTGSRFTIEKMQGDLLSGIRVYNARLTLSPDQAMQLGVDEELMRLDTLEVSYNLRAIFSRTADITLLRISGLHATISETSDESWNFMSIITETAEADPDDEGGLPVDIHIRSLQVERSSVRVFAPSLLPDEQIQIEDLRAGASAFISDTENRASLDHFSLLLREGRLPHGLALESKASLKGERISLEHLLLSTGKSTLRANANFDQESTSLSADLELGPLSRNDLLAYLDEIPEFDDFRLEFRTNGSFNELESRIHLRADGLATLDTRFIIQIEPEPSLTFLELNLIEFYPENLGNTGLEPGIIQSGKWTMQLDGFLPFADPERADLKIAIRGESAAYDTYVMELFTAEAILAEQNFRLNGDLGLENDQQIRFSASALQLFGDAPVWETKAEAARINPAYFANDPELEGIINATIEANGIGFSPGSRPWNFTAEIQDPIIGNYREFGMLRLDASLSESTLKALLSMDSAGGEVKLDALVSGWADEMPEWSMQLTTSQLDLAVLTSIEEIPTQINATAEINGTGFQPENLRAELITFFDNSRILNQPFDTFNTRIEYKAGLLLIEEMEIDSRFLAGNASGNLNIFSLYDPDNRLDYEFEIRNIDSFADLLGLKILSVNAKLTGNISPIQGIPHFESGILITDLRMDDLFIPEISGNSLVQLTDSLLAELEIDLINPSFSEYEIHDIRLNLSAALTDDNVEGSSRLQILRTSEFGLFHEGNFVLNTASDTDFSFETTRLDLEEDGFRLGLEQSFRLMVISTESFTRAEIDTVSLRSEDAWLASHFLLHEDGSISAYFESENLNLGAIQDALLDKRFADVLFSGRAQIYLKDEDIRMDAFTTLSEIEYEGARIDQIRFEAIIEDFRLETSLLIELDEVKLVESAFSVPFRTGNPEAFPDSFFDEPVEGYLRLNEIALENYQSFTGAFQIPVTTGFVSLDSGVSGTAGAPEFTLRVDTRNNQLSGVAIDSSFLELNYDNQNSELTLSSQVRSLGQVAMEASGTLPLFIDMKTFTVTEPGTSDGIAISVETQSFDLAAFNEFLDRDVLRNLQGRLDAKLDITGTIGQPEPRGNFSLRSGQLSLVENNITIRNIRTDIELEPDRIEISSFEMSSSGSFSASGSILLEDFMPNSFDLTARARNFRVFNTRDIDLFVSLDTDFTGTVAEPRLSGSLSLERGYIYLDNFGERQVEQVTLEDEEEPDTFAADFFEALAIDMNLIINRRFFMRNRNNPELDLELGGNLDIVKSAGEEDIQLFGAIDVDRGTATTFGRRFELDEGMIVFSGPADNPEFDIQLSYRIRRQDDIRIIYRISGTAEEPSFEYDSEPEMAFIDILSYMIFGRPHLEVDGWQQGIIAGNTGEGGVADAALDLVLDRLQSIAADRLGVDVVEIETSGRTGGGTRIKAGKYLSDRVFVALVQELGSDQNSQVIIEYLIRRNLELILTGSDDTGAGIDILWRHDY
ncbi:MAG: translocation/assembly module TamB domain-containing protein [Balneolales bacterium]|nr:translocation/assembly module TamB domain-containing protein [Balneolales bacterium]